MIPQLSKALSEGFTSEQILDYILKKFPNHKKKIEKAVSGGFNASQILSYLSKQTQGKGNTEEPTTEYEKLRGQDISQAEGRNQKAIAAGTLAATSLAAPIAASALQRAIPGSLSKLVPSLTAQTIGTNLGQITPESSPSGIPSQPPVNQVSQNIPQTPEAVQPEEIPTNNKFMETPIGQLLEIPKPGSQVGSKHGMGEIKAMRNGKAIIEVDGKKHQVNEDELIESPMPEKDLADLYGDLIGGIEKTTGQQVSRNVEWAGYDPNANELVYKPHGSDKVYVYDDISPEDAKQLTSLMNQRKSTGGNYIGAWEKGTESPIGAGMYQLIKKLQGERGGKGNEYRNRFETIYDALEPAKIAAKKKHAEAKKKAKKSGIA